MSLRTWDWGSGNVPGEGEEEWGKGWGDLFQDQASPFPRTPVYQETERTVYIQDHPSLYKDSTYRQRTSPVCWKKGEN